MKFLAVEKTNIFKEGDYLSPYQISAIIPFYNENGENCTRIIYSNGVTESKNCSVKKFMGSILYDFHLDPHALRDWTFDLIGTKLNTPIVINEHLIFLPARIRKGVGKQDGCYGYLGYSHIRGFEDQKVFLSSGETLPVLSASSYVRRKQRDAYLLRIGYLDFKKKNDFIY